MITHLTPALRLVIVAGAAVAARSVSASSDLADSLALLASLESRRATVELRDVPLDQAMTSIEAAAGVPIRADWESLRSLGIDRDDRVTLRLGDASVQAILQSLILSIGREYERPVFDVGGGQVVVTTTAGAAPLRVTDLYDVRSLLTDETARQVVSREIAARDDAREAATPPQAAPTDAVPPVDASPPPERFVVDDDGDADADPDASATPPVPVPPPTPAARLGELLMQHVDPESWFLTSGGGARIDDRDGVLMVTAPPRVHRQLRTLIDRLQSLHPTAAEIETAIVRLDRTRLDLVRRRHAAGTAALSRAIIGAGDASVLWRSTVLTRLGETALVETQTAGGPGAPPSEHVTLSVQPRLDAATNTLSLATDVRFEGAGRARHAATTAAVPLRDGGALIEFADAGEPEAMVVVIVVTAR